MKISLAGKEFEISHLTVRQSRDLRIGDIQASPDDGAGGWKTLYDSCIAKIATAVREANPEVTEEALWQMPLDENEMLEATRAIMVFAGFKTAEPSIAELRATVVAKKAELATLEQTLAAREEKAKVTGEG